MEGEVILPPVPPLVESGLPVVSEAELEAMGVAPFYRKPKPFYERAWFWLAVGAVVLAVAIALAVAAWRNRQHGGPKPPPPDSYCPKSFRIAGFSINGTPTRPSGASASSSASACESACSGKHMGWSYAAGECQCMDQPFGKEVSPISVAKGAGYTGGFYPSEQPSDFLPCGLFSVKDQKWAGSQSSAPYGTAHSASSDAMCAELCRTSDVAWTRDANTSTCYCSSPTDWGDTALVYAPGWSAGLTS